jgi:hypothetical protein
MPFFHLDDDDDFDEDEDDEDSDEDDEDAEEDPEDDVETWQVGAQKPLNSASA